MSLRIGYRKPVSMRFTFTALMVVQLLLRGLAVSHGHAHDGRPESTDHANRPHLHLMGHAHSHGSSHKHAEHGHSHDSHHRHGDSAPPVTPDPVAPLPDSSDHDEDAVYVDADTLGMPTDRLETPDPTDVVGLLTDFVSGESEILPRLGIYRPAGPPGSGSGTALDLLPHLLRV